MQQKIINAVDESIEAIVKLFQSEPTKFFTENDVVCCFHRFLHQALEILGVATAYDKDGLPHNLIHCEYPTPFRCDMKNKGFQRRADEDRTPRGGKYKRGHFDIVVLNPAFVSRHSYWEIRGQEYGEFLRAVVSTLVEVEPMLLFGVEFDYSRDMLKQSTAGAFVAEVMQDTAKLTASIAITGFMKKAAMLVLTKGTTGKVIDFIRNSLQCVPIAKLIVA